MRPGFLILVLAILTSCVKDVKVPENLIQEEEMGEILSELLVKEEITRLLPYQKDSLKVLFLEHYRPQVLEGHGTNIAVFDSSMKFYLHNPEIFERVAKKSESLLKAIADSLETEHQNETKRNHDND